MKKWHKTALDLKNQNFDAKEITDILYEEYPEELRLLKNPYNSVCVFLSKAKKKEKKALAKEQNTNQAKEKRIVFQNQEPDVIESKWDGGRVIRFGLMGDTQMGSKYTQLTYLHEFYDLCALKGINAVYHTGDICEGLKMRVGHEYELYKVSADDMVDDVIDNYPQRPGITTYFITGNHDASIYKQVGYDIGLAISRRREDMKYLGRDCAVVNLTPNCTLELRHPWDGTAYATSYKLQKMIEAMESDSKPNILAVGHYHKAEYLFYRNVHAFQTACFQAQTPFTRGKGISTQLGGWILEALVNEDGSILSLKQEFIPYYKSIKDDYKTFKKK